MKHKGFYTVLFVLTVMLLAIPAVQQYTQWFKFKPLKGSTMVTQPPKLTWKSFMAGTFQQQEDKYLTENLGFREPLVRCYNQLSWSLFHKVQNKTLFVGDEDWLFNDFAMKHHYGQSMYDYVSSNEKAVQKMNEDALMLYKLQQILQSYGITFFVCLAPSKDMVCEEHLPEVKDFDRPPGVLAIDYYPPLFDSLGIHYIDFSKYYLAIKDTVSYPLYLKTSSHWSNQAAVYAADTLFRYMEALSGIHLNRLCIGKEYLDKSHYQDTDLENVMNLIWPIGDGKNRYNRISVDRDSTAVKPNLLTVGDSYYWGFQYNLKLDEFFETHPYWYYNNTVQDDPLHQSVKEVDVLRALLSSDLVMVLYSPCNLFDLNRNFLTSALLSLCYEDGTAESKIKKIKQDIKNTPEWYAGVEQKALAAGRDVESALEDHARYMLMNKPGSYLAEFNDTTVPVCRNSRIEMVWHQIHDEERKSIRNNIISNAAWLQSIREKAEAAQTTIDVAIEKDIDWLVKTRNKNKS